MRIYLDNPGHLPAEKVEKLVIEFDNWMAEINRREQSQNNYFVRRIGGEIVGREQAHDLRPLHNQEAELAHDIALKWAKSYKDNDVHEFIDRILGGGNQFRTWVFFTRTRRSFPVTIHLSDSGLLAEHDGDRYHQINTITGEFVWKFEHQEK